MEANIEKLDKARRDYYKTISSLEWGNASNYDLTIDKGARQKLRPFVYFKIFIIMLITSAFIAS